MTRRCSVKEPVSVTYDYADAFEVNLREGDTRTAEQVFRTGFGHAPAAIGELALAAHRHVLRFRLGPVSSPEHVVGWRITSNEPDVLCLQAEGSLIDGMMVARRTDGNVARLTTFVTYRSPLARIIWAIAGPVHRKIAPRLLERAARAAE